MTSMLKKLGTCSVLALVAAVSTPAMAAGTLSGTNVLNTATVSYSVGSVAQPNISASNTFTVDQKVNLTVAEVGNVTTSVSPGATAQVTTFTVTNNSNSVIDIGLQVTQSANGTPAPHGGSDSFDVLAPLMYRDTNNNGVYNAGTDVAVTYLDELAADASATIFIVANIPVGQANNSIAEVNLIGTAKAGGTSGTEGAALTATAGANTSGVDTVLADAAGAVTGDIAADGRHSDDDDYTVSAATLTVAKYSQVLWDPINGTTNPKMIPGAIVQYCIAVSNASGGANATSVSVNDTLPVQVSGTLPATPGYTPPVPTVNGSGTTTTCSYTGGSAGGTVNATTATAPLNDVTPGSTLTFTFPVVVL